MQLPSAFSILKIGIGPSSSHTLGPCLAARNFRCIVADADPLPASRLQVRLCGSLALTGKGHLTDAAVVAGLSGFDPEKEVRASIQSVQREVARAGRLRIGSREIPFSIDQDIEFDPDDSALPHPNTLVFRLLAADGSVLLENAYTSLGGGRVSGGTLALQDSNHGQEPVSMSAVLESCLQDGSDLARYMLNNERVHYGIDEDSAFTRLSALWEVMISAMEKGLTTEGVLPGKLMLERRASELFDNYQKNIRSWGLLSRDITLAAIYAIAGAEENASGGRVVTAPTCGSAGIVPATLRMLGARFRLPERRLLEGLLVAGLIGSIVVVNGSIAGAEVGCQGEVGVASAMAAAAAVHCLEGTAAQAEFAAEIALEHHLGLTCDPVCGLVQVPCIERNAVGAVTALNAANLALLSSGRHLVSFDTAVSTMRQVGKDMNRKYKETALGGLALATGSTLQRRFCAPA